MRAKWVFAAITACAIAHSQGACAAGVKNLAKIKHIIVIFEENRSFDSLYGHFPNANGLDRTADGAPQAAFAPQIDAAGFQAREVEQVADQALHVQRGFLNVMQVP